MPRFDTLHDLLAANARDDRQITFIEGDSEQRVLHFQQLQQRALGLLGALQRRGLAAGDTMLLCVADNERFIEMFWACVLGGIVPVPLAPGGADEHRRKLLHVGAQFDGASLFIDLAALDRLETFAATQGRADAWAALRRRSIVPGSLDPGGAPGRPHPAAPDDLAFIQFSSGSTGQPKGVMLTHRNLTANVAAIFEAGAFSERDIALSWMPLSHDMGLIGFHLNMLGGAVSHALMRTELFARRPLIWLEQASRRRATVLCSPNFGYAHCLRQYASRPPAALDLSAVRLVFNGAEPISAGLCRRFEATLAPHGLKPGTLFPVYGLAEASLAVSFPRPGAAVESVWLDSRHLQIGGAARSVAAGAAGATEFVKLGSAVPGTEIRIVDAAGAALGERQLGHVQIRGENVSRGYWGERGEMDPAHAPGRAAGWLDTGDLGLVWDGQLVITGRAKDLIIVNGQNFYPHDLERIATEVDGIDPNRVAAAGVRSVSGDTEQVALFVLHRSSAADFVPRALAVRRTLLQQAGLDDVQIVPVTEIPKTTSGKLQRYALAAAYEAGRFDAALAELAPLLGAAGPAGADLDPADTALGRLLAICKRLISNTEIGPSTNLLEINLNSLSLARVHEAIEREFPQRIEVTDFFEHPTLAELAVLLESPRD